jgi:two-component system, chemotaxis family, protein-glutamate methylesterase/glutaminase
MNNGVNIVRVLVVDDSAFVRKVVREMLSSSPLIEVVGVARDGLEALEMTVELSPDVITCDVFMPNLDGVGFIQRQMARRPLPILVLTSAPQDAERVVEALNAGAVDLVQKPTALATDDLRAIREELVEKVKTAARAPVANLLQALTPPGAPRVAALTRAAARVDIVVLGISTGGPQALRQLLPLLPADFPVPIVVVLHMPPGYTALFAQKLNESCPLEVREAHEGDTLRPGQILIAPAGRHLQFRRLRDGRVTVQLTIQPLEKTHRPSADVLFRSAAEIYRERVLAIVMTGMGEDGKEGAAWVKAHGGTVLTEDEKSCIIYGMPRSVVEAGLSDASIPLTSMAQAITERI